MSANPSIATAAAVPILSAKALEGAPVRHAFFTRQGGVSQGLFEGLNCGPGSNDESARVAENRARAAHRLGAAPERLVTPYQTHSRKALTVAGPWAVEEAPPESDGLVTDRPGLAVGVLSADCAPILFADKEAGIVAAAHAGWRGALAGVTDETIAAMERLGAKRERIVAAIGPCIARDSYEVTSEFLDRFIASDARNRAYFTPGHSDAHHRFDLPGYLVDRLRAAGARAGWIGRDTYADPSLFFSYRRNRHAGEEDYGRLLSAIVISG